MATRFYFHNATSALSGLPTDEQSSLTPNNTPSTNPEARTINRTMTTTKGTSEITKTFLSNATTSSQNYYITRFVSPPLDVTSVTAQTWTYAMNCKTQSANANFPVDGSNVAGRVNCYVWRPGTSTKIGTIRDGTTAADILEASTSQQFTDVTTFTGALVSSMLTGDVIIFEVWFQTSQVTSTAYNNSFYYDGTVTPVEDAAQTDIATFVETPQNLTFPAAIVAMTNVSTKTLTDKFIQKV